MSISNPDMPRMQPSIEVDEATGKDLTAAAQKAVTNFADIMANVADEIRRGHTDGLIKLGFDFGVSMAYVELDLKAIVMHAMDQAPHVVQEYLDKEIIHSFGGYSVPVANVAGPVHGRPTYSDHDTSTVRLYLRNVGS